MYDLMYSNLQVLVVRALASTNTGAAERFELNSVLRVSSILVLKVGVQELSVVLVLSLQGSRMFTQY